MKLNGFIKIKQGDFNVYNTSTWVETNILGVLECLKIITPDLYETIINQDYDEDGYLNLKEIIGDLFPTDEVFKNVILKEFVENKYFLPENEEDNFLDEEQQNFKLSKEQFKQNIGVLIICRFKSTPSVEHNYDNVGVKFKLNKIFCYYDPNTTIITSDVIKKASLEIKNKYQSFLDSFVKLNPYLETFTVIEQ